MATLSIGQKAQRVVQFLLALRSFAVASLLAKFGFGPEDLAEGWRLLSRLTQGRLDDVGGAVDKALVAEIDGWENLWFPVAEAALASKAPEAHAMLFANLTQTSGPAVIASVSTLIDRSEKLEAAVSDGGLGRGPGREARQLLTKRGLTTEVIAEAKALLARATSLETESESPRATTGAADDEAERALWAWYLEWSSIARVAIKDRRVLRQCGFLKPSKASAAEPEASAPPAPATNGAPA